MTSSERFSLDKDWDKLNIKTIFRKKSTNAIGLELQITELISGMLSYNWWVCCVTMFQVRVSLARETRRPIQPWERNLNHPNKNALRATASGKWFNILKQSRNRSESGVSVFLCVTWTPLIFTCFDACGVPIYNAWNTQMKSRNGNLQRNKRGWEIPGHHMQVCRRYVRSTDLSIKRWDVETARDRRWIFSER